MLEQMTRKSHIYVVHKNIRGIVNLDSEQYV